jgi:molybdopterin-containing oxidoreductase family membrane subunit
LGRINLVAVGQIEPVGVRAGSVAGLVSFTPSLGEWIVFLFSLALLLLVFTLGEKYLMLDGDAG